MPLGNVGAMKEPAQDSMAPAVFTNIPLRGRYRFIEPCETSAIDGAPITYVIAFAAVTAVFSFIPISVQMGTGGAFPMSQGINPIVGVILGPIAGAIATLIGTSVGVILAPHTAGIPFLTVMGCVVASFAAGCFGRIGPRWWWFIPVAAYSVVNYALYAGRAVVVNGVPPEFALFGAAITWVSIFLFVSPWRKRFIAMVQGDDLRAVAVGFFWITLIASSLGMISISVISYWMFNWPTEIWIMFIGVLPMEGVMRGLVGAVIGTGIVAGMRATSMTKPRKSLY